MVVYFDFDETTFNCSTIDGIAHGLSEKPLKVTVNYWNNAINWIQIHETDKYLDAPFKFTIDLDSYNKIKEIAKNHKKCCDK
jgi:hypothetical protein